MKQERPFLIGIAGGSCSGKTIITETLSSLYPKVTIIKFDDYILGKHQIDYSRISDWERIELYDIDRLREDLARIKRGETVAYAANSRESTRAGIKIRTAEPTPLVIIEGFLLFLDQGVRNQLNLRIFLNISEEEVLRRRLGRKTHNSMWDNELYIRTTLLEGHRMYVQPTRIFADHVLDATQPPEKLIQEIDRIIRNHMHTN